MTDYALEDTIYGMFTTRAFATGIPTVLSGSPVVSVYENDNLTQITAGITLGVDHDSVVGLNLLTIAATTANGYEQNKDYTAVITTGTVGGVSVVGEVVFTFSIERSAAAKRVGTMDIAAATGDPGTGDPAIAYLKQLVNVLVGSSGVTTFPVAAAPANGVSLAEIIRSIYDDSSAILVDTGTTIPATISTAQADLDIITGADGAVLLSGTQASIDAIEVDTNELQTDWANGGRLDLLLDAAGGSAVSWSTQITDSVAADGVLPTREQAVYMMLQFLTEFAIVGTTYNVKKVDGSTALMTFTLDSTQPTSITRSG